MSKTPTHSLGALMLFLDGVKPEWEDPANAKGGHFQFTMQAAAFKSKASFDFEASNPVTQVNAGLALMDEIWNNLVGYDGEFNNCLYVLSTGPRCRRQHSGAKGFRHGPEAS